MLSLVIACGLGPRAGVIGVSPVKSQSMNSGRGEILATNSNPTNTTGKKQDF